MAALNSMRGKAVAIQLKSRITKLYCVFKSFYQHLLNKTFA